MVKPEPLQPEDLEYKVVLVEHGGAGSKAAGPVAKEVLDYYMKNIYDPSDIVGKNDPPKTAFSKKLQAAFSTSF